MARSAVLRQEPKALSPRECVLQPSAKSLSFFAFDSISVVAHTALRLSSVAFETEHSTEPR